MYLDCDTTPIIRGRTVRGSLEAAKRAALKLIAFANEGQIGIYDNASGGQFYGYAIKYRGERPFFEERETE